MKKVKSIFGIALSLFALTGSIGGAEELAGHRQLAVDFDRAGGNSNAARSAYSVRPEGLPGAMSLELPSSEIRPPSQPLIPTLAMEWGRRPVNLGQGLAALDRSYALGGWIGLGCGAITGGWIGWSLAGTGVALAAGIGGGLLLGLFLGVYILGHMIHEIKRGPVRDKDGSSGWGGGRY